MCFEFVLWFDASELSLYLRLLLNASHINMLHFWCIFNVTATLTAVKNSPQCPTVIDPVFFFLDSDRTKLCLHNELQSPPTFTFYHPVLTLTVRVLFFFFGVTEGSVARAHGLHWGWLKALTLFAYQMPCGRENTDLHDRKPTS